jgi:LacI family transcriptional regulator
MQEIAAAVGVSRTTVSHALSGNRPVNQETVARIRALIDRTGYIPDARAQRLAGQSRIMGLIVPDISAPYFGKMARGVEEFAHERGYALVVGSTANFDPDREQRYFDMLRNHMIDGLIYNAAMETPPLAQLTAAAASGALVMADESVPSLSGVSSVISAHLEGARAVGRHLAELGHQRIVIITGFPGLQSQRDRVLGIKESFPDALVLSGNFDALSGYEIVGDLLKHGMNATAIACGNDMMAVGAIQRLKAEGLKVPSDISVTGFDDIDAATIITPKLTTVRSDIERIGRESARILIESLDSAERTEPEALVLPVELVVRQSTGIPSPR